MVRTVDTPGPAAGRLATGDRIVAVNGDLRVVPELSGHFLDLRPGDAYTLRVDRSGAEVEVSLSLAARAQPWPIWLRLQFVVLSLGFYAAGLFIGLLRPAERTARFYVFASLMAAAYFLAIPLSFPNYLLGPMAVALVAVLWMPAPLFPAVLYDGFHRFPPGVPSGTGLGRPVRERRRSAGSPGADAARLSSPTGGANGRRNGGIDTRPLMDMATTAALRGTRGSVATTSGSRPVGDHRR